MKIIISSLMITLAITAAVIVGTRFLAARHSHSAAVSTCAKAYPGPPYTGVAAVPFSGLTAFGHVTETRPNLHVIYRSFGTPLSAAEVGPDIACGVLPLIQLNPYNISLTAIASGYYDSYLKSYGTALSRLRARVALSFAPEANGTWYSWGCRHTAANVYVAAWRHIHDVITQAGARNIIWVWDANHTFPSACPLAARWPGKQYVDWIAVDGYWREPGDSFATTLAPTIASAIELAHKPVLIGETGAPNKKQAPGWVRSVFQGVEQTPGVIGIVWFNYKDSFDNFRLQDDPRALAMFRREAANYR